MKGLLNCILFNIKHKIDNLYIEHQCLLNLKAWNTVCQDK